MIKREESELGKLGSGVLIKRRVNASAVHACGCLREHPALHTQGKAGRSTTGQTQSPGGWRTRFWLSAV